MLFNPFPLVLKHKMCESNYDRNILNTISFTSYTKYGELNYKKQNVGSEKGVWNIRRRG